MFLLKYLLIAVTAPFWLPALLVAVGFFILLFGAVLLFSLLVSLFLIVWLLKLFYVTYFGLVSARKEILKEIDAELNSVSWCRLLRLIFNRHLKKLQDFKQYDDYVCGEQEKDDVDEQSKP